jgi:hypothetical protein
MTVRPGPRSIGGMWGDEGSGSRLRRIRRGDFDFERAVLLPDDASKISLYLARASWRSASFVETACNSCSSSSIDSVPEDEDTTT